MLERRVHSLFIHEAKQDPEFYETIFNFEHIKELFKEESN